MDPVIRAKYLMQAAPTGSCVHAARGGSSITGLLQLMRPANLFTAAADIAAGCAVAGSAVVPALVCSGVALYAGGVVFNDIFDRDLDARERPERPLPSGRTSLRSALVLGGFLLLFGIGMAWLAGPVSGAIAALIACLALAYDAAAKHHGVFGPAAMGSCRALNFLLGLSSVPAMLPERYYVAAIPLAYVAGITAISAGEVHGGTRRRTLAGTLLVYGAIAAPGILAAAIGAEGLWAAPIVALLAWRVAPAFWRAMKRPDPGLIRKAVVAGVLSLMILDAVIAALFGHVVIAAVLLVLSPVPSWVARRFAVS